MVSKTPINPTKRRESGLWNLNLDGLQLPEGFEIKEHGIIYLPPGVFGGNHKHPRHEVFVGIGDQLYMVWLGDDGTRHEDKMMEDGQLYVYDVEPHTPHAVINRGIGFAVLAELANGPNINIEGVDLLGGTPLGKQE